MVIWTDIEVAEQEEIVSLNFLSTWYTTIIHPFPDTRHEALRQKAWGNNSDEKQKLPIIYFETFNPSLGTPQYISSRL